MSALFRRHSTIQCFFCHSTLPYPSNIRNFKCTTCACWNRYDAKGEIISDEPAMHQEHLNSRSFAKRGTQSKDRLPTLYGPAPFCHSCQTNQTLLLNLLANYLPDPESPDYPSRLESLPGYRESLHARYPPVCESCLPQVEDELRRKEHMARVQALGGWLHKGKERQRRVSSELRVEKAVADTLSWWKLRGVLWALTTSLSMAGNIYSILRPHPPPYFAAIRPILPFLVVVSLLWTIWDPTYSSVKMAKLQGRDVRIQGKHTYIYLQLSAWIARLISSIILASPSATTFVHNFASRRVVPLTVLSTELATLIGSACVLRIHQPPAIRLVDTSVHRPERSRSGTPAHRITVASSNSVGRSTPLPEPDILASLSLSSIPVFNKPSSSKVHPVFGQSSLQPPIDGVRKGRPPGAVLNENDMDWTPTSVEPTATAPFGVSGDRQLTESMNTNDSWLRPQRFFAPEKPTGLEGLFESARIQDEPMPFQPPDTLQGKLVERIVGHFRAWIFPYAILLAALSVGMKYFFTYVKELNRVGIGSTEPWHE